MLLSLGCQMGRHRKIWKEEDLIGKSKEYQWYLKRIMGGLCGKCGRKAAVSSTGIPYTLCARCRARSNKKALELYYKTKGVGHGRYLAAVA